MIIIMFACPSVFPSAFFLSFFLSFFPFDVFLFSCPNWEIEGQAEGRFFFLREFHVKAIC